MVLLWLFPKRAGASLAAAGWRAAVVAHCLAIGYGVGMIAWAQSFYTVNPLTASVVYSEYGPRLAQMSCSEILRTPLASLAAVALQHTAGAATPLAPVLLAVGIEFGVVLVAAALMPFVAAGEPAGVLFGRCLRLSLWSTTLLLPLGAGWMVDPRLRQLVGLSPDWHPVDFIILSMFAVWWTFVVLRSGYRYAGPASGPACNTRPARCERCGYLIAHLPHSTKCPECSRPVLDSLPERRSLPAFAIAPTRRKRVAAFCRTLRDLTVDRAFFDHLAVHRGHAAARTFFITVCLLNAMLVFLVYPAIELPYSTRVVLGGHWGRAAVAGAAFLVGQLIVAGLICLVVAGLRRVPLQQTAVAVFYGMSSTLTLVLAATVLGIAWVVLIVMVDTFQPRAAIAIQGGALALVAVAGLAWGLLTTTRTLYQAITRTRFAAA
jgi:hypothetical protein